MRALDPRFDTMPEADLIRWLSVAVHVAVDPRSPVGARCAARNRMEKISAELRKRNGEAA